jgi:hypothetical protein
MSAGKETLNSRNCNFIPEKRFVLALIANVSRISARNSLVRKCLDLANDGTTGKKDTVQTG